MRVEDLIVTWSTPQAVLLVAVYLLIVLLIGYAAHHRSKDHSEQDFFATKWSTGWIGVTFTMSATMASAAYVMGTIGVFYSNPPVLSGYLFGAFFGPMLLWMLGRRLWPLGRRDGYTTYTDFIGDFYRDERLRVVISLLVTLFFAPYFAVNLVGPGLLLNALTGGSVSYAAGVVGMAVVTVGYTLMGGVRGVIWTDVFQASIMYLMFLVLIPIAISAAGGFGGIVQDIPSEKFLFDGSLQSWMLVISWFVTIAFMIPGNPDRGFRLLAASSLETIRNSALASVVLLGAWAVIALLLGWSFNVVLPGVQPTDMVMPVAISQLAPWLMPFFLVALIAGGMSTLDSGLISVAAMVTKDIYRKNINPHANERQVQTLSRAVILFFGLFAVIVALTEPPFLWYLVGAGNAIGMQWLPAMFGGLYWKRANAPAAWAGTLSGLLAAILFQYVIPSPWPGPGGSAIMGLAFNVPLYVIVALLTKPMPEEHLARYQGVFRTGRRSTEVAGHSPSPAAQG